MLNSEGQRQRFFRCKVCAATMPRGDDLRRHVKCVHKEEMKLAQVSIESVPETSLSEDQQESSQDREDHETQSSQPKIPKVEDSDVDEMNVDDMPDSIPNESASMTSFEDSMSTDTPTKKRFPCPVCHTQTSSKYSLERHIRTQHKE